MKKIFKYIFCILFMLPVIINATSFDNAVKLANDYYKNFDSFSLYFRTENNLPYEYDGSNKINSKFTSGGMLSKTEYDITVNGSKSYLFDGTKYWEIKGNIIDKTSSSVKTKVTEFTKNDVKVSGVGSFTNPWKFYDSYKVTIRSNGNGYIEQTGKLTYTKSVSAGSNIVFSIIGNNGYAYLSNDCGSYASYNEERNQLLISNVNKNIMCSVSFGVSNYSYSLPTVKYTISNPNSGVRECTFSNAVPQTFYAKYKQGYFKDSSLSEHLGHVNPPYRRGWTFKGYYIGENQLINSNGDFTTNYELINNNGTNITFKATENTYKVTFDVTKYNTGSTTATIGTKNIDVTFDHDPNNITIPTKTGYTFEGYYLEGKFNGIGATTKYFDKDGKSVKYWDEDTNTTLYANWTSKKYTLTYNANGGNVSPTSKSITFDEAYGDLPNPTRAGYVFQGWYKENTFVNKVESTTIYKAVGNSTIYAKWKECSKGHYCPGDNTENACAKGTYQDKTGQTSCIKCSAGKYNDLTGQTDPSACKACPVGSYCPNQGTKNALPCSAGTYQSSTGKTSCIDCEAGSYSSGEGAAICIKCAVGSYQANTAQTKCLACTSGKTSVEGGTKCTACSNNENVSTWNTTTWSNNVVSNVCSIKSCDTNYHIDSGACKKDSYTIAFNANSGSGTMNKITCFVGEDCTLSNNSFTKTGYTFTKWNTDPNGSGNSYSNKEIVKNLTTNGKNVTLYAQWRTNYTYITYDISDGTIQPTCILSDGSTGYFKVINGIINFSNKENGTYSEKFDYSCNRIAYSDQIGPNGVDNYNNTNFINITRTGYKALTGAEWICKSGCPTNKTYDQKDNTYTSNDFCDSKNGDCTVVLKVNWRKGYTVTLDANGGSVSSSSITVYKDMKYGTIPTPTRNNYTFSGWYTAKTGGSKVTSDTIYNYDSNTTIYARWEQKCELYASLSGCDEYGKYIISVTSECEFNSCDGVHKNVKRFEATIGENEVYNACINWTDGGSASNNVKVSDGNFYRYSSSKGDYVADSNYTVEKMCYSELMSYNKEGIYLYNIVNGRRVIDNTSNEALGNGVSGCYILKVYKTPFVDNGHQYFRIVPGTYYTTGGIGREYIRDGVYIYGGCLTTTNASCVNSDTCKNN